MIRDTAERSSLPLLPISTHPGPKSARLFTVPRPRAVHLLRADESASPPSLIPYSCSQSLPQAGSERLSSLQIFAHVLFSGKLSFPVTPSHKLMAPLNSRLVLADQVHCPTSMQGGGDLLCNSAAFPDLEACPTIDCRMLTPFRLYYVGIPVCASELTGCDRTS